MPSLPGRVLALDVGKKRIGLAMSDPLGITAQGLPTLHRNRIREDLDHLAELCSQYEVSLILIGRPIHMSGDQSSQAVYTEEFGDRLKERTGIPVEYLDERLTSAQAVRMLRESGGSTDRRTGNIDRMSAILILQSYLESRV